MTMSEETALTKWCPFSRASSFDGRHDENDPGKLVRTNNSPSYNRQWVQDFDANQNDVEYYTRLNPTPSACMCIASKCMMWEVDYIDGCGVVFGHCGLKHRR